MIASCINEKKIRVNFIRNHKNIIINNSKISLLAIQNYKNKTFEKRPCNKGLKKYIFILV